MRTAIVTTSELASALKQEFGFLMFGSQRTTDWDTWLAFADTILDTIDPMGESDPNSPYYDDGPVPLLLDNEGAVERLARAGFEPDSNVCAGCHHHGSRHDLNNRCLDCIEWADDHFVSMTKDEQWARAIAALRASR